MLKMKSVRLLIIINLNRLKREMQSRFKERLRTEGSRVMGHHPRMTLSKQGILKIGPLNAHDYELIWSLISIVNEIEKAKITADDVSYLIWSPKK